MSTKRVRVDLAPSSAVLPFQPMALELVIGHHKPQVWALPHIIQNVINMLLISPRTNMEKATQDNLPNMVSWLAAMTNQDRQRSGKSAPTEYREARFLAGVFESAKLGSIALIRAWFTYLPEAEDLAMPKNFEIAVREGHTHLSQWLLDEGKLKDEEMISNVFNSHDSVIEWLQKRFPRIKLSISFDQLVEQWTGPEALAFMKDVWKRKRQFKKIKVTLYAMSMAASRGDLEMLEWLDTSKNGNCHWWTARLVVENGHTEIFKWLKNHPSDAEILDAARLGNLEILKLRPNDIPPEVTEKVVKHGHLEVLKWLHAEKKLASKRIYPHFAASKGHLEVIQWLHQLGYKCNSDAVNLAAQRGQLHVIQWLYSKGIRGSQSAMNNTASSNSLDIVQWLHNNGSEGCSTQAMDYAAGGGFLDIVIWLHENRTEGCTSQAMRNAAANGHLNVVEWLHQNRTEGCGSHAICKAASNGHFAVVQWLYNHDLGVCDCELMKRAVKGGSLEMVKWIHANRPEDPSDSVLSPAIKRGHLEIAKWLIANKLGKIREKDMEDAVQQKQLNMAKWLHATSPGQFSWYTFSKDALSDLYKDPLCADMVEWLIMNYPRSVSSSDATNKRSGWAEYPRYPPDVFAAKKPRKEIFRSWGSRMY